DLTPDPVAEVAGRMGIRSRIRGYCSSVLGANEVNTLEMASAYGTLATNGVHVPPVAITKVTDATGRLLYRAEQPSHQVLNSAVSWIVTQILRKVMLEGTGVAANIGRPAAGKTGTAQQWRDAWFVGYIPQLTAGVWVGFPQAQISMVPPRTRMVVTGGSLPAAIWKAFMLQATRGMPVRDFKKPVSQFVTMLIDVHRGCIATALTPAYRIREVQFVRGTEPTRECTYRGPVGGGGGVVTTDVVPSVIGLPVAAAENRLAEVGLASVRASEYNPNYPPGTVIGQRPPPGHPVPKDGTITLIVSTNEYPQVPSVVGLSREEAIDRIRDAGFAAAVFAAGSYNPAFAPGAVVSQSPKGGAEKPPGTTVTIRVNPDPPPSPPPSPSPSG
ncbi:MAG TPA: PASTA domain-containing protein, partial [Actinomycetota bacterium]|nr:PASTA domain-containing protein [Actinomycetota bacterium]